MVKEAFVKLGKLLFVVLAILNPTRAIASSIDGGALTLEPFEFIREVYPLTIATSEYTTGEALGTVVEVQFSVSETGGRHGLLAGLQVLDADGESANIKVRIFADYYTANADQAAFAIADGEMKYNQITIEVASTDYDSNANNSIANIYRIAAAIAPSGTVMRLQCEVLGTHTWTDAADLTVVLYWLAK